MWHLLTCTWPCLLTCDPYVTPVNMHVTVFTDLWPGSSLARLDEELLFLNMESSNWDRLAVEPRLPGATAGLAATHRHTGLAWLTSNCGQIGAIGLSPSNGLKHIHTYMHTYIHRCSHTSIHTYTHTHTYIHTHTYTHTHIHTHIHTYIHNHTHTYIHTYIQTYRYTYIHTYIHTHIYTNTHKYIHTYIHGGRMVSVADW